MKKLTTYQIAVAASMAALAFVLDYVSIRTGTMKFTIYGLPLLLSGILFGPVIGGLSGLVEGFISQAIYGFGPTTIFWMLAPIAWGLVSGIVTKIVKKESFDSKKVVIVVITTSIIVLGLNTFAMWIEGIIYEADTAYIIANLPARLGTSLVLAVAYCFVLIIILPRMRRISINYKKKTKEQTKPTTKQ